MNLEYLKHLLSLWTRWMKHDDYNLGYPKRSLGMSSGGASTEDTFDEMYDDLELNKVRTLNAVINELNHEERKAVHHFHLGSKAPMYKELKYEIAIENILKNISKRLD